MNFITGRNSQWMKAILVTAGMYNILWGSSVVFFPEFWFNLVNLPIPNYLQLWQVIGMIVGVYGLGFIIASTNPLRHWPIVLVGFLGKLFGPIGFLYYYIKGDLPLVVLNMNFTNDIIWLVPFGLILYNAYKHEYLLDNDIIAFSEHNTEDLLAWHSTNKSETILDLSMSQPVMMVFLRHFGCTFCRETLQDLYRYRDAIEKQGTKIVLVHQLSEKEAIQELKKFHLDDLDQVSDPELMLFKGFHLRRGTILQLFGLQEWKSFLKFGVIGGLGIGSPGEQDPFQMPGIFIIQDGKIIKQFVHKRASDVPPYVELAKA
jgi:hypothetical protein